MSAHPFENTAIFQHMDFMQKTHPVAPLACELTEMNYLLLLYHQKQLVTYHTTLPKVGKAILLEKYKSKDVKVKIGTRTQLVLTGPFAGSIISPKDSATITIYRPLHTSLFDLPTYIFCELPPLLKLQGCIDYLNIIFKLLHQHGVQFDEEMFRYNSTTFTDWLKTH